MESFRDRDAPKRWPCAMPGLGCFLMPSLCAHLLWTSTFSPCHLLLWKRTVLQGMTWSPSSLIYLIGLDTNCNMPWFRELPFPNEVPRELVHTDLDLWTAGPSSSLIFFIETMPCQLSSKREPVIRNNSWFSMNSGSSGNLKDHRVPMQSRSPWHYSPE